MTLDWSALLAILFGEPGYLDLVDRILQADVVRAGAPTLAETGIVLTARGKASIKRELAALLRELDVTAVAFTSEHYQVALSAYERFGRGRHQANLNFGDCLSYPVAALAGGSLLYVGDDFAQTDIEPR